MPFDDNLILIDGSVSMTAATAASFLAATSTTIVAASGARVLDIRQTGVRGLAAVLVLPTPASAGTTDYLLGFLEASDVEAFTSDVHELGKFDIAAAVKGRILSGECPATVVMRFATDKQYIRANFTPTVGNGTANFGAVKVLISPYPFVRL